MSSEQTAQLDELISVIFVVYGDTGPKVLFRYPHDVDNRNEDQSAPVGLFKAFHKEPQRTSRQVLDNLFDSSLQSLLIPKQGDGCHKRFYVEIDNLIFIGYPFQTEEGSKNIYNIVFVVEKGTPQTIIDSLFNLSTRMSIALAYEERHCSYLSDNVSMMDRFYSEFNVTAQKCIDTQLLDDNEIIVEHCPFTSMINEDPNSLASNLKYVFESIKKSLYAKVLINRTINFSFFVQPREVCEDIRTSIAPFESFVLLDEPNDIKASLNYDSSPSIVKLLEVPRPYFRNIKDIAFRLDLDYEEIHDAVLALVRWRKALILYPIVNTNEYMLSHQVPVSKYPYYAEAFTREFKGYDFYTELSKFSQRIDLSEILDLFQDREKIDTYKSIVVWFLRRRLLVQLFAHVYLKPSPCSATDRKKILVDQDFIDSTDNLSISSGSPQSKHSSSSYASLTRGSNITEQNRKKVFYSYLSEKQIERLKEMNLESNLMLNNFAKVLPHAHVGRTIEEILWRTNMERRELHDITETFNKFLITIKHPSSS